LGSPVSPREPTPHFARPRTPRLPPERGPPESTRPRLVHPLSEAGNPKPTRFVDGRSHPLHTLPFHDIRALEDVHELIDVEPVQPQDKVMIGLLATIGIERGKPFNPQGKRKAAMEGG
jgi:hypothetical protein